MKKDDMIYTPRFCTVRITKVYRNRALAKKQGFVEPTHYQDPKYDIYGKHTELNHMIFAAIKKA